MKKFLGELALIVFGIYFGICGILMPFTIYHNRSLIKWNENLYKMVQKYEYYFDGANNRNLLDICTKNGKQDVYFKDECGGQ